MPDEQEQALYHLKKTLESAKESIDIAIYSFTNKEIAKVLRDRAKNGVRIAIIYDNEANVKNKYSTIGYLAILNNVKVCTLQGVYNEQKKYYGIMHQKLAIVDGKKVVFGSANWSKGAFENNYEILYFTDKIEIVQKAKNFFNKMQKKCIDF